LEWAQVRALVVDGVSKREIARRLGINRRTVARLARRAWSRRVIGGRRRARSWICSSRCCGVCSTSGPQIKAPRATEVSRDECGYAGSVDLVKRRLRELRASTVGEEPRCGIGVTR